MVFYLKSDLSAIGREDIDRGVEKFLELCVPEQSRYDSEELLREGDDASRYLGLARGECLFELYLSYP